MASPVARRRSHATRSRSRQNLRRLITIGRGKLDLGSCSRRKIHIVETPPYLCRTCLLFKKTSSGHSEVTGEVEAMAFSIVCAFRVLQTSTRWRRVGGSGYRFRVAASPDFVATKRFASPQSSCSNLKAGATGMRPSGPHLFLSS